MSVSGPPFTSLLRKVVNAGLTPTWTGSSTLYNSHLPAVDMMRQTEMGSDLAGRFQRDTPLAADKMLEHRGGNTARLSNCGQRFSTGGNGGEVPW